MKNAIIDPRQDVSQITGWVTNTNQTQPITTVIQNSARVAEVSMTTFPIAAPLFWIACSDDVVADQWYYNTSTQSIAVIPPAPPKPVAADQPSATGVQTV